MPFPRHSSSITIFRVFAAVASLLVLSPTSSLRAEGEGFVALTLSYCEKIISSLRERFVPSGTTLSSASESEKMAKRAVLDRYLKSIFLEEKGYFFTQSQWGAKPIPYQLDRLEVSENEETSGTPEDARVGIEARVTFTFKAKAYRIFDAVKGWGKWEPGLPPNLENVSLVKQNGDWQVSLPSRESYSLR